VLVEKAEKYTVEDWVVATERWIESTAAAVLFVMRSSEDERAKTVTDGSMLQEYLMRIDRLVTEDYETHFFVAMIHLSDAALARIWDAIDGENRPELVERLRRVCDA
jgi:hypothetical protein